MGVKALAAPGNAEAQAFTPRFRTSELFGASCRVLLEHRGQEYVLLITGNGGLVLNRWSS
ncbi:MAG: hemin uptake protein HemP [Planctomycetes bacterium]|nr:hemin uptake protein HemP [Planctomycetota bacterium]